MREEQELANIFGHFVSASEANSVRIIQITCKNNFKPFDGQCLLELTAMTS